MWTLNAETKAQHTAEYLHLSAASESRIQTLLKAVSHHWSAPVELNVSERRPLVENLEVVKGEFVL